jgi:hypothetical protein
MNAANHFVVIEWLMVKGIPRYLREDFLPHLFHPQAVFLTVATSAVLFMKLSQMERKNLMFIFVANMLKCNKSEIAGMVARAITEPVEVSRGCLRVCWWRILGTMDYN